MKNKKYCFSYIRFSSSGQRKNSSVDRQSPIAERVALDHGWIYKPEWNAANLGVSAFKGDNVKTINAIIDARKRNLIPEGTVLILESLDRATRLDLDSAQQLIRSILICGLDIYTDTNRRHLTKASLNKATDVMLTVVELDAAFQYSHRISVRSIRGMEKKIRLASNSEKVFFGGQTPTFITGIENGEYVINQYKYKLLKRIFLAYLNGDALSRIATDLNADVKRGIVTGGIKRNENTVWSPTTIKHILTNKNYAGEFSLMGKVYKIPEIVTMKDFEKIQMMIKQNGKKRGGSPTGKVNGILTGIARCAICQSPINAVVSKQQQRIYNYSTCYAARLHNCKSEGHWLNTMELELDFMMLALKETPDGLFAKFTPKKIDETISIRSEISELENKITQTADMLDSGFTAEVIKGKMSKFIQRKSELEAMLQDKVSQTNIQDNIPQAVSDIKKLLADIEINESIVEFEKLESHFKKQLQDNDIRTKLKVLLPQLVKQINVDTIKGGYTVVDHTGKESDFHQLVS